MDLFGLCLCLKTGQTIDYVHFLTIQRNYTLICIRINTYSISENTLVDFLLYL